MVLTKYALTVQTTLMALPARRVTVYAARAGFCVAPSVSISQQIASIVGSVIMLVGVHAAAESVVKYCLPEKPSGRPFPFLEPASRNRGGGMHSVRL